MASPRYTRQYLFTLRNHISIDRVIDALAISASPQTGQHRFICPVCSGENTGIKPETNLGRCFNCEKNYNTIDLVMKVMDVRFVQSVEYLEKLKADMQAPPAPSNRPRKAPRRNNMVHISDVFKSLIPPKPGSAIMNHTEEDKNQTIANLEKRVSGLEQQINLLSRKIALLLLK